MQKLLGWQAVLEKYVCAWTRRLPGGRARDPLDDVCMWVSCVYDLRVLYICCIVVVYALWCSRRLNLTAEIALASPHPPVATLLAHTCTQVHRPTQPNQADAYIGEIDVSRCI